MTLPLSSTCVNVVITRQTGYVSQAGFGTLLFVSPVDTTSPDLHTVRYYSSLEGVAADFAANEEPFIAAQAYFSQNPKPTRFAVGLVDNAASSIVAELNALQAVSNDWYGLALAEPLKSEAYIIATAGWIEAQEKLCAFSSVDGDAIAPAATSGPAYELSQLGYHRACFLYLSTASYADVSMFGRAFTTSFSGTNTCITLHLKSMPGIAVEEINETELNALRDKNANVYIEQRGVGVLIDGRMCSGEWFDIMHGVDALAEQIRVNVFRLLTNTVKVPYTDAGTSLITAEVNAALDQFSRNGYLASTLDEDGNLLAGYEPAVAIPVGQVPANDRAMRVSPDITWTARVAGAVHFVEISGTLIV
jgi:hypothetical protein